MGKDWRDECEFAESLIVRDCNGPVGSPQCNVIARFVRTADRDEAVRIVNAHDALVAALEEARELLRPHGYATTEIDAALAMARKGG